MQEFTNYHFEVKPDALYGALDRFAQFFIAPLCKAEALEREVQAVNNEFVGKSLTFSLVSKHTELCLSLTGYQCSCQKDFFVCHGSSCEAQK